jgi:hypothetical protein
MDLLDPKPLLNRLHGKNAPFEVVQRAAKGKRLMGSPFRFARHGQAGHQISELLPNLAHVADEIAVIRSATSTRFDHDQGQLLFSTGRAVAGFPSIGSWVSYGLGRANEDLPAYVAMGTGRVAQASASGFLPPQHQGTPVRVEGVPIFDLAPPRDALPGEQRRLLGLIETLNRGHQASRPGNPDLEARITNFELAARMQGAATRAVDLSREPGWVSSLYGLDQEVTRDFGRQCLLARRLVEAGVRFVHLVYPQRWDHHEKLNERLPEQCLATDRPVAALLMDLRQRGLLDETLVVWTGEFGRLPTVEGDKGGRDHNPHAFSLWMAGGGVRGGVVHGATDDFGYAAVDKKVTIADLHATMLRLLGLDVQRLTYDFEGRDETLVGVSPAKVIEEILA